MMKMSALAAAAILSSTFIRAAELEKAPAPLTSAAAISGQAAPGPLIGQIQLLRSAAMLEPLTDAQLRMVADRGPAAIEAIRLQAARQALASGSAMAARELDAAAGTKASAKLEGMARSIVASASPEAKASAALLAESLFGREVPSAAALPGLKARLESDLKSALDALFEGSAEATETDVAGSVSSERQTLTRAKRVERLEAMSKKNPRLALSYIKATLDDPEERSAEILINALRLLAPMSPDWISSFLSHVVADSKHYYLRREAAKMLGAMGQSLSNVSKRDAVAALQKAAAAEEAPTRLMARDVLARWGVDPGPEVFPQPKPAEKASNGDNATIAQQAREALTQIQLSDEEKAAKEQAEYDALPAWKKVAHQIKKHPKIAVATVLGVVFSIIAYKIGGIWALATLLGTAALTGYFWRDSHRDFRPDPLLSIRPMLSTTGEGSKSFEPVVDKPTTRFDDVAGIDEAMTEIEELKDFLKHPDDFAFMGAQMPRGALLVGPPGTGKTLLARALAGEAGVPFYAQAGSDFVEQYVGVGASRVRVLFRKAHDHAPAIIFIDEIDAIGGARNDQDNSEWLGTLTAMLTQLDGFDPSKGVLLIGATNRLDSLDPALRRRFDRLIYVGQPDVMGREAILQVHARKTRLGPDVDLHKIAKNTAGLSGSYLAKIVNEAAILSARRNKGLARDKMGPITQADFNEAVEKITVGTTHSMIMSEADKKRLARHEAGHQVLRLLLEGKASTVTMVPRGHEGAAGYSRKEGEEQDRIGQTSSELSNDIVIAFGGRVAEEQAFGDFSTGVSGDMAGATNVARAMVEQMGMGKRTRFGATAVGRDQGRQSEGFKAKIDDDIQDIKEEAYERAKQLLNEPANKAAVERLEAALLERETLSGEQSAEIAGVKPLAK